MTDRRSVSGGGAMCRRAAVKWFSISQKYVSLSRTEAEYVALSGSLKEALFLRHVWCLIFPGRGMTSIKIFEDNHGVTQLAQSSVSTLNLHHFSRELILEG